MKLFKVLAKPFAGKSKKKLILILCGVIVLVAGGVWACSKWVFTDAQNEITEVAVSKGNIEVSISGTAVIEANEQYNVTSLVTGEIIADYFEEGDVVEAGAQLYQIDTQDAQNSLEKAQNNLTQAQDNYNSAVSDLQKLTVKSSVSGTITNLYIENGDDVAANTTLADVVDSSKMILKLPFLSSDAAHLSVGQTAQVQLSNSTDVLQGTVQTVPTGNQLNSYGVEIRNVEIVVDNPGAIKEGDSATAVVGGYACQDSGTFRCYQSKSIVAETAGTVSALYYHEGDYISAGATLAKLESTSLNDTVRSRSISLKDSQLSMENSQDLLDNYSITAPISGTVIQKTSKAGDSIDSSNGSTVMCVIADMSKIVFTMDVDELDIGDISVGQKVEIEADALPGRTYSGYVDYISNVGTSAQGATSYPVTVVVENPEDLKIGYSISATIIVDSASDVLTVPVSAVQRGNYVYVKSSDADTAAQPENDEERGPRTAAPDGFTAVRVETGLTDSEYIEITSGLKEGDTIAILGGASATTTTTTENANMGGGMPGGGMPSGGMPSGGGMPGGGGMR